MFSPRIQLKPLIGLCRRASTALEAGIDVRTVFAREADRATGHLSQHLLQISRDLTQGESLADALAHTEDYFPTLFRELIEVGEQTGGLDAVLGDRASYGVRPGLRAGAAFVIHPQPPAAGDGYDLRTHDAKITRAAVPGRQPNARLRSPRRSVA